MEPAVVTKIKQAWLVKEYLDIVPRYLNIVSKIVSTSSLQSTTTTGAPQGDCSRKRTREAAAETINNAPTANIASAVTAGGTQQPALHKRVGATPTATSGDAPMPKARIRRRSSQTSSGVCVRRRSELKVWCAADMHAPESWGKTGGTLS